MVVGKKNLSSIQNNDELESQQNKEQIILMKEIGREALKIHDVEDFCTGSIHALNESVRNYFYLDRELGHLIKQLDSQAVTLKRLRAIWIKLKS